MSDPTPPGRPFLRIAVIDDHPAVRIGIAAIADQWPLGKVALQATDGEDYVRNQSSAGPIDIAIVDLSMPIMDGYSTMQWMKENQPSTMPLAISFEMSADTVRRAMRSGARGVLDKTTQPQEFHTAFDHLRSTGNYVNDLLRDSLVQNGTTNNSSQVPHPKILNAISHRERVFLKHLCAPDDPSYEEIGARMSISKNTACTYSKSLFKKFGVNTRQGLFRAALNWKLI